MEYRVIEKTDGNNNVWYLIEYKRFLFWNLLGHHTNTLLSEYDWEPFVFKTIEAAELKIQTEIRLRASRKRSKQITERIVKMYKG